MSKLAEEEYKLFCAYNHSQYLPEMEPVKVLGAIDDQGNPQEPVLAFGPVNKRGATLPSGKNHADYIDKSGYYDLVRYLNDHKKTFPTISSVGIGQILCCECNVFITGICVGTIW